MNTGEVVDLTRGSPMRRLTALVLVAAMSACSTEKIVPPAPAELAAQSGIWAVLTRSKPNGRDRLPMALSPGEAATTGAKAGATAAFVPAALVAAAAAESSSGEDAAVGMLLAIPLAVAGLVMAPVTAIVGAGVGAGAARSKEEIAAAETSMTAALDEARVAAAVRERMVVLAEERAGRRVYDCGDSSSPAACLESAEPELAMLVTMEVSQPYLWVQGSIEPTLGLLLSADATVLRVRDGATVHWRSWIYRGRQQGYFDLAADNAKLFRAELTTATDALAAKVVDDLLIGGGEEVHASARQPEGTVWTVLPPASARN